MKNDFSDVISRIIKIENELEQIGKELVALCTLCYGQDFPEQQELANKLEDQIESISHETATEISFQRDNINTLHKFIEFRKTYSNYNDNDLGGKGDGTKGTDLTCLIYHA